jgi:hypothetical protein
VRRYLALTAAEWEALSWDMQETYLDGLSEDPEVPFSVSRAASSPENATPGMSGPVVRENVDTGSNVFDIRGMIAGLEAARTPGGDPREEV